MTSQSHNVFSRLRDVALFVVLGLIFTGATMLPQRSAFAGDPVEAPGGSQVMQGFVEQEDAQRKASEISTKERHQILFIMGAALLILILTTGGLGIAMAVSGKPLFVPHMIFAGLSITLALAHSVAAVVWFFPF